MVLVEQFEQSRCSGRLSPPDYFVIVKQLQWWSGASPGQKMWGGHAWRARGARACSGGLGGSSPQRGPAAEPLVRCSGGKAWQKWGGHVHPVHPVATPLVVVCVFKVLESLKIGMESSASRGESHRILVTISDIVCTLESTSVNRILAIADTMSSSAVRQPPFTTPAAVLGKILGG